MLIVVVRNTADITERNFIFNVTLLQWCCGYLLRLQYSSLFLIATATAHLLHLVIHGIKKITICPSTKKTDYRNNTLGSVCLTPVLISIGVSVLEIPRVLVLEFEYFLTPSHLLQHVYKELQEV